MYRYILRRLLYAIPVLFGILLVIFVLVRLIPGDPWVAAQRVRYLYPGR